jgi:hypothetical protein
VLGALLRGTAHHANADRPEVSDHRGLWPSRPICTGERSCCLPRGGLQNMAADNGRSFGENMVSNHRPRHVRVPAADGALMKLLYWHRAATTPSTWCSCTTTPAYSCCLSSFMLAITTGPHRELDRAAGVGLDLVPAALPVPLDEGGMQASGLTTFLKFTVLVVAYLMCGVHAAGHSVRERRDARRRTGGVESSRLVSVLAIPRACGCAPAHGQGLRACRRAIGDDVPAPVGRRVRTAGSPRRLRSTASARLPSRRSS